jgi:hypothetical protein
MGEQQKAEREGPMKVKDLITLLQSCNGDDLVILAKDAEGNGFSPARQTTNDMYLAESTWSGEVRMRELTPEMEKQGYSEEDVGLPEDGFVNCVVLWPIN